MKQKSNEASNTSSTVTADDLPMSKMTYTSTFLVVIKLLTLKM